MPPKKLGNSSWGSSPLGILPKCQARFPGVYRPGRRGQRHPNASMGGHRLGTFAATSSWQRDLWCSAHRWKSDANDAMQWASLGPEYYSVRGLLRIFWASSMQRSKGNDFEPCAYALLYMSWCWVNFLWDIEVKAIGERNWKKKEEETGMVWVLSVFFQLSIPWNTPPKKG